MEIAVFIFLLVCALGFFAWILRAMLRATCPECRKEGRQEMVIPIVPGFRWLCPACSGLFKQKEVLDNGQN